MSENILFWVLTVVFAIIIPVPRPNEDDDDYEHHGIYY